MIKIEIINSVWANLLGLTNSLGGKSIQILCGYEREFLKGIRHDLFVHRMQYKEWFDWVEGLAENFDKSYVQC